MVGLVTLEARAERDAFARSHSDMIKDVQVAVKFDLGSRALVYFVYETGWVQVTRDECLRRIYGDRWVDWTNRRS